MTPTPPRDAPEPARSPHAPIPRRILLRASGIVFFLCALRSAILFYAGQPFDFRRAVISSLASPAENPRGYLWIDAGIGLASMLLGPVAFWLLLVLRRTSPKFAATGSLLLGAGVASAFVFALKAPGMHGFSDTNLHLYLAYAAFILTTAGTLLLLLLLPARTATVKAAIFVEAAVFVFLLYLFVGEFHGGYFFDDNSLLRSIALCEWLLCLADFACLAILTSQAGKFARYLSEIALSRTN